VGGAGGTVAGGLTIMGAVAGGVTTPICGTIGSRAMGKNGAYRSTANANPVLRGVTTGGTRAYNPR
jgi:hypothetical protein